MSVMTTLKLIAGALLALLGGMLGLKAGKHSARKQVEEAERATIEVKAASEQAARIAEAAVSQARVLANSVKQEKQAHQETVRQVKQHAMAVEALQEIKEEHDEQTAEILDAGIADRLQFMRNESRPPDPAG